MPINLNATFKQKHSHIMHISCRVIAAIVTSIATSYDFSYKTCTATQRYRDADLGLRS